MLEQPDSDTPPPRQQWFLYMIRCPNGHLYTGITTDIERRFQQHQAGKGARYLRGKAPLSLVFQQATGSHSDSLKLELAVKKLSKPAKETMISNGQLPAFATATQTNA